MYDDSYFPDHVVDQGKAILLRLCGMPPGQRPAGAGADPLRCSSAAVRGQGLRRRHGLVGGRWPR
ncbi:DUF5713 family protein [Streptomyces sp. NPDC059153]|uniref:DUF5713 family protein n=1 Tax=Streptomyces sp. NPDC059153 TaxID=3346743 RepID=UPI00368B1E06